MFYNCAYDEIAEWKVQGWYMQKLKYENKNIGVKRW